MAIYILLNSTSLFPWSHKGPPSEQNSEGSAIPHVSPKEFSAQCPAIPPSPFVQGFGGAGNHMPFLYPHSFMPPILAFGFRPPAHVGPSATTDPTEAFQKRGPQESVKSPPHPPNSNKKRRAVRKKPEIVELDDIKDDLETLKNSCHWKDHWVIQLVTL